MDLPVTKCYISGSQDELEQAHLGPQAVISDGGKRTDDGIWKNEPTGATE